MLLHVTDLNSQRPLCNLARKPFAGAKRCIVGANASGRTELELTRFLHHFPGRDLIPDRVLNGQSHEPVEQQAVAQLLAQWPGGV